MTMDLHYTSGIILFFSSVIGCLLPFQTKFDVTPVRPLSTGIIFGVALCHLLPDAGQILDTEQVTDWFMNFTHLQGSVGDDGLYDTLPVAETLMCLGIFIMLVIDQCIPCPHHQIQSDMVEIVKSKSLRGEEELLLSSRTVEKIMEQEQGSVNGNSHHNGSSHHDHEHHHHHDTTTKNIATMKVYATEVAIAIHSIIIGFTMGVNPDTDALIGLTIAMIFHQMFEGIALAMIAVQGNLGFRECCFMVIMFASSLPIGILLGLYIYSLASGDDGNSNEETTDDDDLNNISTIIFQGFPNAIAAGMLLHIGFELMMEDFNHDNHKFPTTKLLLAFIGGSLICFLAIWA